MFQLPGTCSHPRTLWRASKVTSVRSVRCIFLGHLKKRRMWVSKEVQERTRNFLNFAGKKTVIPKKHYGGIKRNKVFVT